MKRRSRTGGNPTKGRALKAAKPTTRNPPKGTARSTSSSAGEKTEVGRLTRELNEALERQTATSEVLQSISRYPGDLQPVFQAMLKNAVRLCDAKFGNIYRWDGDALHLVATENAPVAFAQARGRSPLRPGPETPTGRMIANKTVVHATDMRAEKAYADRDPYIVAGIELGGVRTVLMVPMLKDDELIGAFSVYRQEVRPFTDKQIALVQNFAAQAVIAIENTRLLNELQRNQWSSRRRPRKCCRSSQALLAICSPSLRAMLRNATQLCRLNSAPSFFMRQGKFAWWPRMTCPWSFPRDKHGVRSSHAPGGPLEGAHENQAGACKYADLAATDAYRQRHPLMVGAVELGGIRTAVAVPMLKDDEPIGVIAIHRPEVRSFDEKQIALLTNFAAQAVIAIENARLLNELRQSLEQQTATSQVLQVISSSPGDLEQVFATILQNATRICEAKFGALYRSEGDGFRAKAMHNAPPAYEEARAGILHPPPRTSLWRAANTKQAVQIADVRLEKGYIEGDPFVVSAVALGGYRSVLNVPMLHEDELVGVITIFRQEVRPFTEEQISLVKNFAAQAVIAIENARLLSELRQRTADLTEALEQQTATSEVLRVISTSPANSILYFRPC